MKRKIHRIQRGTVWFAGSLMGSLDTIKDDVGWLGTARFDSLKLNYVRAVRRKRLDGILEIPGLVIEAIVSGLQRVHNGALNRKVNAFLSEAAL